MSHGLSHNYLIHSLKSQVATDNTKINECSCVPIKIYMQKIKPANTLRSLTPCWGEGSKAERKVLENEETPKTVKKPSQLQPFQSP